MKIGAVSYLNTKPLIYGWQVPDTELVLDLPSRLADRLHAQDLDIALIPSVEFLRSDNFSIVSDACIACRGPVRSVQILFRCPPSKVRSLALDEGSRTSAALAQVLLHEKFGIRPQTELFSIQDDYHGITTDAIVIIGDRAMQVDHAPFHEVWDLGQAWYDHFGLPFVFAVWATYHQQLEPWWSNYFQQRRDDGYAHRDALAHQEAPHYGLQPADCLRYFEHQLHFRLGAEELAGLDLFRTKAVEIGLLPAHSTQLSLQPL